MTTTATKPADYKHVAVWGRQMGSFAYYIKRQQELAFEAGAPINAIFERYANDGSGPTGEWATADTIQDDERRAHLEAEVAKLK